MKLLPLEYKFSESLSRMDSVLNEDISTIKEEKSIPIIDDKKSTNQIFCKVWCTTVCVRFLLKQESQNLKSRLKSFQVQRIFITEVIKLLNFNKLCMDVSVVGNTIMLIYNTPHKTNFEAIMDRLAMLNSLVNIINLKSKNRGLAKVIIGVGVDYNETLMIQSNPKITDSIMWTGECQNRSLDMAYTSINHVENSKYQNNPIRISFSVFNNLSTDYQKFFGKTENDVYSANFVNVNMNNLVKTNQ